MKSFRQLLTSPLCGIIWGAALLSGTAFGQTLTTIQDTLYKADGTHFTGTLNIQWRTFDAAGTGTIAQQAESVDVVNGILQIQLVPNATATAPANIYTVHYQSDANQQFTETWTVPASTVPLTVAQVRVGTLNAGTVAGAAGAGSTITESSVLGLLSDLSQRPIKGPGFGTGSAAVINQNGQIEAAVGDIGECVLVDGTTGPCGGAVSQYFDAETPGGIVDGSNNTFTLANSPSGSSLMLFRNGLYMSASFDYTLSGSIITFVPGGVPQPTDTLIASYRIDPLSNNVVSLAATTGTPAATVAGSRTVMAQVLCSGNGTSTSSAAWTSLGACELPAAALKPGDRIAVRFSFTHTGTASAYNVQLNWGNTAILARQGSAQDVALAGEAEAGVTASTDQITVQSWGTLLSFLPSILSAAHQKGLRLDSRGQISIAGSDSLALTSYTVMRYPAN